MPDRWNEDRDRNWRDRDEARPRRYGRHRDDDYRSAGDRSDEARSFSGGDYRRGSGSDYGRDRVFGEWETGEDYTHNRNQDGYRAAYDSGREGGRDRVFGERETGESYVPADQTYRSGQDRGAREYGEETRARLYREQYGQGGQSYGSPSGYQGQEQYRYGRPGQYADFGFGHYEHNDRRPEPRARDRGEHYTPNVREGRGEGGRNWWDRTRDEVSSWFGDHDAERRREWDAQTSHRGRGPKGYRRSDERITEEVHDRLTDDPWIDASSITVTVANGEVTLSGTVNERGAKHRAERLVEDISGVDHVQNNLRVQRVAYPGGSNATGFSEVGARDLTGSTSSAPTTAGGATQADPTMRTSGKGSDSRN